MTNYKFPFWLYLYCLATYNLGVAHDKLYFFFYVIFDKIELHWYLLRKKGDEKVYHLEKFSQEIQVNGIHDVEVLLAAKAYLDRFGYREESLKAFLLFFHYGAYNRFFFDRYRLMAAYLYFRIKDAADLVKMAEALEVTDQTRAVRIFGKDGYDHIRRLSITELYSHLQQEPSVAD